MSKPSLLGGRDGNHFGKGIQGAESFDERQELRPENKVDLVDYEKYGTIELLDQLQDKFVFTAFAFRPGRWLFPRRQRFAVAGGIDHEDDDVAAFQGFIDLLHHAPVELRARPVDAGGIHENDLSGVAALACRHLHDSLNSVARGLRLVADDGDLFADKGIQQR